MPNLDFSEVYCDSVEFIDVFSVTRSIQTVDDHGRAVNTPKTYPSVFGIVRTSDSGVQHYFPEAENLSGKIVIITKWRLTDRRGTAGIDTDIVRWNGRDYTVMNVSDYSRLGTGYVIALCELRDVNQ